jgi:hypothetical protein
MRRYVVMRTDKRRRDFISRELEAGRLRQGWGWKPEHDLRVLREKLSAGAKLNEEESSVWRNRRLLDTEGDGLKPGDIVIVPNIPEQGRWALARVTGAYRYEPPPSDAGVGSDYAHVVPVEAIRTKDGKIAVVEADNENVDARLRASMRTMSRMWSVDAMGAKVDDLIRAIESGKDTARAQPETEKFAGFSSAVAAAAWEKVRERYKAAEFEMLVLRVFRHIYDHGRTGRVEHWGGAGEKGADLLVFTQDPLGLEFKIAVQVKLHDGEHDDVHALDQIKWAHSAHSVDAGVVLTTATTLSERFTNHQQALEAELGIDIRVLTRDDFLKLLMAHLGVAGEN